MRLFGSEKISSMMTKFGWKDGEPIEHKMITNSLENAQKKVEELEAEGTSGGGLVKVKINGKNVTTSLSIDESLISKDEKEILEDLNLSADSDSKDILYELTRKGLRDRGITKQTNKKDYYN